MSAEVSYIALEKQKSCMSWKTKDDLTNKHCDSLPRDFYFLSSPSVRFSEDSSCLGMSQGPCDKTMENLEVVNFDGGGWKLIHPKRGVERKIYLSDADKKVCSSSCSIWSTRSSLEPKGQFSLVSHLASSFKALQSEHEMWQTPLPFRLYLLCTGINDCRVQTVQNQALSLL